MIQARVRWYSSYPHPWVSDSVEWIITIAERLSPWRERPKPTVGSIALRSCTGVSLQNFWFCKQMGFEYKRIRRL